MLATYQPNSDLLEIYECISGNHFAKEVQCCQCRTLLVTPRAFPPLNENILTYMTWSMRSNGWPLLQRLRGAFFFFFWILFNVYIQPSSLVKSESLHAPPSPGPKYPERHWCETSIKTRKLNPMKIFNLPDQQFRVALDVGAITFDFCSLFNFRMSSMYLSNDKI